MALPNGLVDPNVPNFSVYGAFQRYGYTPTQQELDMFASAFMGRHNAEQTGLAAVSDYVNAKKTEAERQANDPLKAYQEKAAQLQDQMFTQANTLYGQLQDLLSSAPELFGGLTPDQVQQYLAPLKTSFDQVNAQVQTDAARRGAAGSSLEAQATAQQTEKFKENVLATGLQVGINQKGQKAQSIQQQIQNLLGIGSTAFSAQGAAAAQRSAQDLSQSNLITSLPFFERQAALQTNAILDAQANKGGLLSKFYDITGAINQGMDTLENVAFIPQQLKSQGGASSASRIGLSPTGAMPGGSIAGSEPGVFSPGMGQEALL